MSTIIFEKSFASFSAFKRKIELLVMNHRQFFIDHGPERTVALKPVVVRGTFIKDPEIEDVQTLFILNCRQLTNKHRKLYLSRAMPEFSVDRPAVLRISLAIPDVWIGFSTILTC